MIARLIVLLLVLNCAVVSAGEPIAITSDGKLKRWPIFTPNGEEIVYAARTTSPSLTLMRVSLTSKAMTPFHDKAVLPETNLTFSADGKVYSYLELTGNDQVVVRVRDVAGTRNDVLKFTKPIPWDPVILPDGIAVVVSLDGRLALQKPGAEQERQLTNSAGINNWPSVSPDGRSILFSSSRNGDYELFVIALDGTGERRLTESRGFDGHAKWSPDGRQIAFTSTRDGNYEIYVMDADGTRIRRVTKNPESDDFPAWHPNGRQLVYVSERGGRHDLYLVDVPAE